MRMSIRYVRDEVHEYAITITHTDRGERHVYYRRLPDDPALPWMLWEKIVPSPRRRRQIDAQPDCCLRSLRWPMQPALQDDADTAGIRGSLGGLDGRQGTPQHFAT